MSEDKTAEQEARIYPCIDCGKMRSKAEGGTVFTVCDKCWDKAHPGTVEEYENGDTIDKRTKEIALQHVKEREYARALEETQVAHVRHVFEKELAEAERRGEERGFNAARRANNGCVISIDYSEGGGPKYPRLSDWRASEEYRKGK